MEAGEGSRSVPFRQVVPVGEGQMAEGVLTGSQKVTVVRVGFSWTDVWPAWQDPEWSRREQDKINVSRGCQDEFKNK